MIGKKNPKETIEQMTVQECDGQDIISEDGTNVSRCDNLVQHQAVIYVILDRGNKLAPLLLCQMS